MTNEEEMRAVTNCITNRIESLIEAHYNEILELSSDEGAEGVVKLSLSVELDYSGKTPTGAVNIRFARTVKDGAVFSVEPEPELPLE